MAVPLRPSEACRRLRRAHLLIRLPPLCRASTHGHVGRNFMDHIPSIGSLMTPFPHVVQLSDSLLRARTLMVEHQMRHLPVKDANTLVGVLTDRDLKRALDPDLGLPPKAQLFVRDVFVCGRVCRRFVRAAGRRVRTPRVSSHRKRVGDKTRTPGRNLYDDGCVPDFLSAPAVALSVAVRRRCGVRRSAPSSCQGDVTG